MWIVQDHEQECIFLSHNTTPSISMPISIRPAILFLSVNSNATSQPSAWVYSLRSISFLVCYNHHGNTTSTLHASSLSDDHLIERFVWENEKIISALVVIYLATTISLLRTSRVWGEQAERASETKQNTSQDHLDFLDLKVPIQKKEQEVVEG
jgi:hypothetical protein